MDFNSSRTRTQNLYAFSQDITGDLGIHRGLAEPLRLGPAQSFVHQFRQPQRHRPFASTATRRVTFGDSLIWNHGKHTWRWGGDFRRIELNTETDSNPRGTFIFTGDNTAQPSSMGRPVANTGYDFADFLLGLPQQTSVQYRLNPLTTNSYHFRGNSWDAYAQDEWKLRGNLTFNLGVRCEYVSPFTELNNHIANLIISPAFYNPWLGTPTADAGAARTRAIRPR